LFKADEEEEKEGEIDLDAILEQAEVREEADDDAHQSEANKELLGAFKCTTIAFEETEKEVEPESVAKKLDWTDIIPEELRQEEKAKNPNVLTPNPDGQRRRRRIKKMATDDSPDKSKGNSSPGSSYENSDSEASDEEDDGSSFEMEQKLKKAVKKKEGPARTYTKKIEGMKKLNARCFPCGKSFSERYMYKAHIKQVHDNVEPPENSDPANLALPDDMVKVEKNSNKRCFPCGKSFSYMYEAHIKQFHDNVEPPENSDPANLALPDERISCLICSKKFGNKQNLKSHIKTHLGTARGIASKNNQGSGSKDEEEKVLIEKMFNSMRRYGCSHCDQRFNHETTMKNHEKQHEQNPEDRKGDIEPNSDIVVRGNNTEIGYEVFKVVSVYTTGKRFKCVKYTHLTQDRWTLTEEMNKNVMKVNIIKVLKTLKKDEGEKNVFTVDMEELKSLTTVLTT